MQKLGRQLSSVITIQMIRPCTHASEDDVNGKDDATSTMMRMVTHGMIKADGLMTTGRCEMPSAGCCWTIDVLRLVENEARCLV
jgi:hypothetical protein